MHTVTVTKTVDGSSTVLLNKDVNIKPHTITSMNDYTAENNTTLRMMHPDVQIAGARINCVIDHSTGLLTSTLTGNVEFHGEGISMFNGSNLQQQCHAHVYVYESTNVVDFSTGENRGIHDRWVKKGRVLNKAYISDNQKDKWIKIELTANNHGRIIDENNDPVSFVLAYGTPQGGSPGVVLAFV